MFINKYFGFCDKCKERVKPNRGFVEKQGAEWKTFCVKHGIAKHKEFDSQSASKAKEQLIPASRRSGW